MITFEFNAENILDVLSEKLNKKIKMEQVEISTETFETAEVDDVILLEKIMLNFDVNVSKTNVESFQFTIYCNNMPFDDEDQIFDFIEEIVQEIKK